MKNIAIVGATGLVGEKLLSLTEGLRGVRLRLFGNASVGKTVVLRTRTATVESCEALLRAKSDIAMFMTPNEVSAQYIPQLVKRGVICVDNSSHFRLRHNVPLVVPCVNGESARGKLLIANPNCSTIQTVIALNALKDFCPQKMTAVTFQSASGAGKEALDDLEQRRCYGKLRQFRHPLYDNLIPMIGELRPDGTTTEERKLTDETRKILSLPRLKVNAFCVRVPVSVCHGVFVNVQFKRKADVAEVKEALRGAPNVLLLDEPQCQLYPMPLTLRNTKYVGVGRVCKDPTGNGINFFCVADNLLRGAAYNAYEILLDKLREDKTCL